ncbi:MAG TPA: methionyl-tRNA formyltransferase [Lachnospiraceae bacterium]|nr:methionyl-tRNA formyltransferase [Lachnospiraceae bacterium]
MRVVFMGTPDFAAGILQAVIDAGHEVVCVVAQEDKPKGRGRETSAPPVKVLAERHGLRVFQPQRIKEEASVRYLKELKADAFVVAAYGRILSKELLELPGLACINVHTSLLPRYRGAAPIQWAIINGDKTTGVTIMRMDEGLDTGDILLQREVPIEPSDTAESLSLKLMDAGGRLTAEALKLIEEGRAVYTPQNTEGASYAPMLKKEMGLLDFNKDSVVLERLIRGLYPWPGTFTFYRGRLLKVFSAELSENDIKKKAAPGTVTELKDGITVSTGDGSIRITGVQPEGKRKMSAVEFLRGCRMETGEVLG